MFGYSKNDKLERGKGEDDLSEKQKDILSVYGILVGDEELTSDECKFLRRVVRVLRHKELELSIAKNESIDRMIAAMLANSAIPRYASAKELVKRAIEVTEAKHAVMYKDSE